MALATWAFNHASRRRRRGRFDLRALRRENAMRNGHELASTVALGQLCCGRNSKRPVFRDRATSRTVIRAASERTWELFRFTSTGKVPQYFASTEDGSSQNNRRTSLRPRRTSIWGSQSSVCRLAAKAETYAAVIYESTATPRLSSAIRVFARRARSDLRRADIRQLRHDRRRRTSRSAK